tara:strand:+ start:824 stop:1294 length:471 start_codon:yes stop_codon:yes gene_type:complete
MGSRRYEVPESLSGSLESELIRLGAKDNVLAVTHSWPEAVGPEIARNAWPARIRRDGTLVINTRTSVWAFELNQMAEEIRVRLKPEPSQIKFVVGVVPEPVGKKEDLEKKPLKSPTPESAKSAKSLASEVTSDSVRKALEKAASLSLSNPHDDRTI